MKLISVFSFLLLINSVFANTDSSQAPTQFSLQPPIVKALGQGQRYFLDIHQTILFNVENNIPENNITDVAVDLNNRVWFATENSGFGYIDGENVFLYNSSNGFNERLDEIFCDTKGNIWVGGNGVGIYKIDGNKITHFHIFNGLSDVHIQDISESPNGDIWISTRLGGFTVIANDTVKAKYFDAYASMDDWINSYAFGADKEVWYITYSQKLIRLHNGKREIIPYKDFLDKDIILRDLEVGSDGNLWLATNKGIYLYNGKTFKAAETNELSSIFKLDFVYLTKDDKENLWFMDIDKKIYKYNYSYVEKVSETDQTRRSRGLDFDKNGNIWIASMEGLFLIKNLAIYRYSNLSLEWNEEKLEPVVFDVSNSAINISKYYKGSANFYFQNNTTINEKFYNTFTYSDFILLYDKALKTWLAYDYSGNKLGEISKKIREATDFKIINNKLWFSTKNNTICSLNSLKEVTHYNFTSPQKIQSILNVDDEGIWFTTAENGLYLFKDSLIHYHEKHHLPPSQIVYTSRLNKNQRIFGTWGSFICIEDKRVDSIQIVKKGVVSNILRSGTQNPFDKSIWFNTLGGGLVIYKDGKVISIQQKDGLLNNTIHGIKFGTDKSIRISLQNGVQIFKPKTPELDFSSINSFLECFDIVSIARKDGLFETHIDNTFEDRYGNFWTQSRWNTVNVILKEYFNRPAPTYNLILKKIKLSHEEVDFKNDTINEYGKYDGFSDFYYIPSNLVLPHYNNHLTFDFTAINWDYLDEIKYKYQLVGYKDSKWSELISQSEITFSNLPYGKYQLNIKPVNKYGEEGEQFSYSFEISRPFWHEWWFRTFIVLLIVLVIYLITQFRIRSLKQNQLKLEQVIKERTSEINTQKLTLEEKNKDITDSINYAKRIQEALLPHSEDISVNFKESFILFKPRDIVSGDFYWFTKIGDHIIIAVADCTGHGVPGALMSMIGLNTLNQIVIDQKVSSPAKALSLLDEKIQTALNKNTTDSTTTDGMDIALCAIDIKNNTMQYSGANRPVLILRNGELIEYKPDKFPIGGGYNFEKEFTDNDIQLKKGDMLYLFTDGYVDQFGGFKNKKFKTSNFKKLLLSLQSKVMSQQLADIDKTFETWKGNFEQIDDVCVVGVKI